jgi:septal ring factor EnvC (AmiA/AmiB activator)
MADFLEGLTPPDYSKQINSIDTNVEGLNEKESTARQLFDSMNQTLKDTYEHLRSVMPELSEFIKTQEENEADDSKKSARSKVGTTDLKKLADKYAAPATYLGLLMSEDGST